MSDKPITGSGSLFGGLFGGAFADPQSPEGKEYLRRLEEAARWLAAWGAAESALNQEAKGWIN